MPIDNPRGIFADKKAMLLAKNYNLEMNNPLGYVSNNKYITYNDVKFIVDNMWMDHFLYGVKAPSDVDKYIYSQYYLKFVDRNVS